MSTDRFALENAAHLIKVSKSLITLDYIGRPPSHTALELLAALEKAPTQVDSLRQRLNGDRES